MTDKGIFTEECFRAGKFMFSSTKTTLQAATRSHRKRQHPDLALKHYSNYNR